ncbi:ubiquitin-like modifier-activating enzyme 5-like [Achlya hypogyna]|uniref:Ubiquitin-like modifier-activating enzyme 5-like n=1 Tax=Achlya hypogyna TaxID=1202772 RepID=A0A1V9ZGL0_ACHHY|nr:ubiquitin-like modifier-activating enzyme 5-like [Achlya hypogyna]
MPSDPTTGSALEKRFAAAGADFTRVSVKGKDDAVKLCGRVNAWREDVNSLANHIAAQLQHCKTLRTSKAMGSITSVPLTTETKAGDIDPFRLLRSDIRSLYDFRLSYLRSQSDSNWSDVDLDRDAAQLKLILEEPATVEKAADADTAFQAMLKGLLRDRAKKRHGPRDDVPPMSSHPAPPNLFTPTAPTASADIEGSKASSLRLDEANFTIQKLHREINELKIANAKLTTSSSQLEDSYAHLEDDIGGTAKALSELRLNVDLITNMYKKTCDEVLAFDQSRNVLLEERDVMAKKLHEQLKKVSVVNLELVRKDKLAMYAMGARHEALEALKMAKRQLGEMTVMRDECNHTIHHLGESLDKVQATLLQTTTIVKEQEEALAEKEREITELHTAMEQLKASHAASMQEMMARSDEDYAKLAAVCEKAKKDLVESDTPWEMEPAEDDELHRGVARRVDRVRVSVQDLASAVRLISSAEHPQRPPLAPSDPMDERGGPYSRILSNNDRGIIKNIEILSTMAIMVVGLNGMGCTIAETYCRSGIGKVYLLDNAGPVAADDLERLFFLPENVGYDRVAEVETSLRLVNSHVALEAVQLDPANALDCHEWGDRLVAAQAIAEAPVPLRAVFLCTSDSAIVRNINELCLAMDVPLIAVTPAPDGLSGQVLASVRGKTPCLLCHKPPAATSPSSSESQRKSTMPIVSAPLLPLPTVEGILAGFAAHAALKY